MSEQTNKALIYIGNRMGELSTYQGLVGILTVAGVVISPDKVQMISTIGFAIFGVLSALFPDKFKKTEVK